MGVIDMKQLIEVAALGPDDRNEWEVLARGYLPFYGRTEPDSRYEETWRRLMVTGFAAFPNTILGFGIWAMLMRKYPTATVAPFTLLVPVTGMISSALVLGEPLQWWKIAAGLLVPSGLALNQFGARIRTFALR